MAGQTLIVGREDRLENESYRSDDKRTQAERDCDRILFASEFQRLSGITQVASIQNAASRHHNRLTHTLEVATVGTRIAQRLIRIQPKLSNRRELDPSTVAAACYAHDLGHPPFGHVAEHELNKLATIHDGSFEGNAQSFRIVVSLACHHHGKGGGLNLTAATLNAILKYPWRKAQSGKRKEKWCIYEGGIEEKAFLRLRGSNPDQRKSVEAEIMDWADDIAYSVSDLLDFYKMGLIPIDRFSHTDEVMELWSGIRSWKLADLKERGEIKSPSDQEKEVGKFIDRLQPAFDQLNSVLRGITRPFFGRPKDHRDVSGIMRGLVHQYTCAVLLTEDNDSKDGFVGVEPNARAQVDMLKALTRHYVIRHPALATQQVGFRKVIKGLYDSLFEILGDPKQHYAIPISTRDDPDFKEAMTDEATRSRKVCDIVASLGEAQAIELYHRLNGIDPGISLEGPIR